MKVDFLIVGQGLAGSHLAWQLLERGQRVLVVDRDEPDTCSKIAAGIVTPITGLRVVPSWRVDEMLPFAHQFYWKIEEQLGQVFFHHTKIARLFHKREQQARWAKITAEQPEFAADYISHDSFHINKDAFHADLGGFEMKQAGWLDVPAFLHATQLHLLERLGYAIATLDPADVKITPNGIAWKNITAKAIIFAQGWEGNRNPFFDWVPMNSTKGEILDIQCDTPALATETRIVNRDGWILPLGNGKYRVGSNYDHDFKNPAPTETGRAAVLEKINKLVKPEFTVTKHRAAVRPIVRLSRAIIGRHPQYENVAFFNGLGSKGTMNGPFIANQLAEHLVNNGRIDDEMDVQQNF